jgi:hypothetical protein
VVLFSILLQIVDSIMERAKEKTQKQVRYLIGISFGHREKKKETEREREKRRHREMQIMLCCCW